MEEKVVCITGASSGIGEGTAEHFSEIGYKKLALVARRKAQLEEVAEKCRKLGAVDVLVLPIDLSSQEGTISAIEKVIKHFNSELINTRLL